MPINLRATQASEPLLSLTAHSVKGRNYYAHNRNPPYWQAAEGSVDALYARRSVCERLQAVDQRLAQEGVRLHVFDAWRPREVQAYFFESWLPGELRRSQPELSEATREAARERYWSPPTVDPARPAPHATGAAIDLTLAWDDGAPLFMGSLFDDPSIISASDYFESAARSDKSVSVEEARANRRILYWAMSEGGFANYPNEWWHFSWGDQMWAALTGAPHAVYGLAPDPRQS